MILIALGSNRQGPWGLPRDTVEKALARLNGGGIRVKRASSLLVSAPFGVTDQPPFVNAVAEVATALGPEALLQRLHLIERMAGRRRTLRWGPRTLDLDLIDYHGLVRRKRTHSIRPLVLPHPGLHERLFVLEPLHEVAPRWRHPLTKESAAFTIRKLNRLNGA